MLLRLNTPTQIKQYIKVIYILSISFKLIPKFEEKPIFSVGNKKDNLKNFLNFSQPNNLNKTTTGQMNQV